MIRLPLFKLFSLLAALVLVAQLSLVYAEGSSTTSSIEDSVRAAAKVQAKAKLSDDALKAYRAAPEADKKDRLEKFSEDFIDHRSETITELQKKLTNSDKCKDISATVRNQLSTALDSVSANLATLKTQAAAATTTEELKTIVKDTAQSNKVFGAIMPALNGACASQRIIKLIDGRLTNAVTKLKAAGIDTADIETMMATARGSASSAYDVYLSILKDPKTTGTKETFASAKTKLLAARTELGKIKAAIDTSKTTYLEKNPSVKAEDSTSTTPVTTP